MKNIRVFLSENFQFLEVKFSIYLNRCVFVMEKKLRSRNISLNLNVSTLLLYDSTDFFIWGLSL